jgi:hypothetical protein
MKEEFPIEQYRQTRKWYGRAGRIHSKVRSQRSEVRSQNPEFRIQKQRQIGGRRVGDENPKSVLYSWILDSELFSSILTAGGGGQQRLLEMPERGFVRNLSRLEVSHVKAIESGALFCRDPG